MGLSLHKRIAGPLWRKVGVAPLFVVLATLISVTMEPWFNSAPLVPFYGAVVLSAWYGGFVAALAAMLLSIASYGLFVPPPEGQWSLTGAVTPTLLAFILFSLLLSVLSASRDRAEAALQASERRFRTMLETANEGVWLIDRDGRTQYANDRMVALLGTTPDEVAAGRLSDFVFPEDVPAAQRRVAATLAGRAEEFEFRFRRTDGRQVLVLAGTSPVHDGAGRVVGALGLYTDVTDRGEAEQALRLLDEAGRTLASTLDYEETLQRVAWFAVPAFADWCVVDLLDDDGVARRVAVAHADPDQADLAARQLLYPPAPGSDGPEERVIRSGAPLFFDLVTEELIQTAAQNEEHLAVLRAVGVSSMAILPLRAGGEIYGAMTMATGTASHRRFDRDDFALADQLARRAAVAIQNARLFRDVLAAEDRYRGLFEGTKDGIMLFDLAGTFLDVNPALLEMVGYRRDDLVGSAASLIARGGPLAGEERLRLLQDGQWRGEFELRRRNGAAAPVESWITRVSLPTGPAYVGVLRDVADRKRFERLQEEFLSALAHDLKNPLTAVRGQTQLMRRRIDRGDPPDVERLRAAFEGIDNSALRMTRLLDELTDVMRLRAGQEIDLSREVVDLVPMAGRAVAEHAQTTERHQIHLLAEVDELTGSWDGPRLERVLGNLLGNAVKYSPNGGEITVRIARADENGSAEAILSVEDRGVGIPVGDRELIFERYRRAGNVESIAGSGIGLAGTRRIVQLHGGTISVTSTEGEGSTFTVRLPLE